MAVGQALTADEIAARLRAAGVDENVIAQEAATIAANYADSDEDPEAIIASVIPQYLQRSKSAGNRGDGGYSTDENDPAMTYGGVTAPGRKDSAGMGGVTGWGGTNVGGGTSWFDQNAPAGPGDYRPLDRPTYLQGEFVAPGRPEGLQQPYTPPVWSETFQPVTAESLTSDPGYLSRLNAGRDVREASAAARGSILSGGHQKGLERFGQEFAANEYGAANSRAFDAYRQRYGQHTDAAAMGAQARNINETAYQGDVNNAFRGRQLNENAFQSDLGNDLTGWQARYKAYQDRLMNNLDVARLGLGATTAGAPR